jgi:hypothetical protein
MPWKATKSTGSLQMFKGTLKNDQFTSGLSLDIAGLDIFGAAGIVVVGRGAGAGASSGAGGGGGASGATDSSFTFVAVCANGSEEDPREDGDFASGISCGGGGGGAVTDIVGS